MWHSQAACETPPEVARNEPAAHGMGARAPAGQKKPAAHLKTAGGGTIDGVIVT